MYSGVRTKVYTSANMLCTSGAHFSIILQQNCAHLVQVNLYANFGSDFTVDFTLSVKAVRVFPTFKPFYFDGLFCLNLYNKSGGSLYIIRSKKLINNCFSLKIVLVLAKSDMLHNAIFYLGLHCLLKYPF